MVEQNYRNVRESWTLHDTVLIAPILPNENNGWFQSFANMALQNDIPFFNVRNRIVGLQWNNQDARDVMPYGYYLESIGVRFFCPSMKTIREYNDAIPIPLQIIDVSDDISAHIFCVDLPRHCTGVFQVQQDERLKAAAIMLPSGQGYSGDGYGQGAPIASSAPPVMGTPGHYDSMVQGVPQNQCRWIWPEPIEIPRRATISFKLQYNEYAKAVLTQLNAWFCEGWKSSVDPEANATFKIVAGIQVTLRGQRLAQQRGELHI